MGAKPVTTPMATSPKLSIHSGARLQDPTEYRSVVGSLQYLAFTRPDISFAVNRLSQFMHSPTIDHWNAVKRVLCYLAGTPDSGIFLKKATQSTFTLSQMPTERVMQMIISLRMGTWCILVNTMSPGRRRNRKLLQDHLRRLNIGLSRMLHLS